MTESFVSPTFISFVLASPSCSLCVIIFHTMFHACFIPPCTMRVPCRRFRLEEVYIEQPRVSSQNCEHVARIGLCAFHQVTIAPGIGAVHRAQVCRLRIAGMCAGVVQSYEILWMCHTHVSYLMVSDVSYLFCIPILSMKSQSLANKHRHICICRFLSFF